MLKDKIMEYFNQGFVQSYEKMAQDIADICQSEDKILTYGYVELGAKYNKLIKEITELKQQYLKYDIAMCKINKDADNRILELEKQIASQKYLQRDEVEKIFCEALDSLDITLQPLSFGSVVKKLMIDKIFSLAIPKDRIIEVLEKFFYLCLINKICVENGYQTYKEISGKSKYDMFEQIADEIVANK